MRNFIFTAIVLISLIYYYQSTQDGFIEREGEPDFISKYDNDKMQEAYEKAKKTYTQFVQALKGKRETAASFAIKRPFKFGDGPAAKHCLPERQMPEYCRMLASKICYIYDSRESLYTGLQILCNSFI